MPLEYGPITSEIRYEGKVVGRYAFENGVSRVNLDITYECSPAKIEPAAPLRRVGCLAS